MVSRRFSRELVKNVNPDVQVRTRLVHGCDDTTGTLSKSEQTTTDLVADNFRWTITFYFKTRRIELPLQLKNIPYTTGASILLKSPTSFAPQLANPRLLSVDLGRS